MTDFSVFVVTGPNNPAKQVSVTRWNSLLDALTTAFATVTRIAISRAALSSTSLVSLPVYLTESGRRGWFFFAADDLSAFVTADTAQGVYISPASDTSGAGGAWVRQNIEALNPDWFGAVPDMTPTTGTNSGPAFQACITLRNALQVAGYAYYGYGAPCMRARGAYYLGNSTLEFNRAGIFEGDGGGIAGPGTVLRWADNTTGIRVHTYLTEGATAVSDAEHSTASGLVIRNMMLRGGYVATESESHGIHLRGMATIRDVLISNFGGDGIFANAQAGAGAPLEGNVNLTRIDTVTVEDCRNGLYLQGADANAAVIIGFNGSGNRRWGVWDKSFLGNFYYGCHTAGNGWDGAAASIATACSYSGNRYYVIHGQEVGASTNAPSGTTADNTWWGYIGAGGVYLGMPLWVSGTTFRSGGAYLVEGLNNASKIDGCYAESDQNPSILAARAISVGGFHAAGAHGGAQFSSDNHVLVTNDFNADDVVVDTLIVGLEAGSQVANGFHKSQVVATGTQTPMAFVGGSGEVQIWKNTTPTKAVSWGFQVPGGSATNDLLFSVYDSGGGWLEAGRFANPTLDFLPKSHVNLPAGKGYKVNGTQVVGSQGAAVADATDAASVITQLNTLLARLRTTGLIAT